MNEQISGQEEKLADKIKALQNELGSSKVTGKAKSANEFINDYGNETWFVKNLSNTHVIVQMSISKETDESIVVNKNTCVDLLEYASLEVIHRSQSLRKCFNDGLLERITPIEFFEYQKKLIADRKRADYITKDTTKDETKAKAKKDPIRIVTKTKVEKFQNFLKNGVGITTADFIDWIQNEPLNEEEIEYCMSSTTDKDIRTILIHKKQDALR
jgi:hypothetical protein